MQQHFAHFTMGHCQTQMGLVSISIDLLWADPTGQIAGQKQNTQGCAVNNPMMSISSRSNKPKTLVAFIIYSFNFVNLT
jgi:hypothetical protein